MWFRAWGSGQDSTALDETWALGQASNKPLYAFALLWMSYSLSFGDSDTGHNTMSLTRWAFVGKVRSLLFNKLSKLVIAFLPRSNCLLISWLQSPSAVILEPKKIVSQCVHCFPIYLPWSDGTRCHDLRFLNAEFKANFSLFSFTFIKRLFSSSSLSGIRVVSSAYLRLLILLPAILIPSWTSFSLTFHMMYSAYKLNKQGDNIQLDVLLSKKTQKNKF